MYKGKNILGLIPARGGSKGLPRKNIKLLLGKPLIAWTIEQALASRYLDRVVVSTDDKEIAEISKKYGAEVPFIRPKELARDESKGIDVLLHAINWIEKNDKSYDLLMLLQPTSPLRNAEDIDKSIELLFYKNADSIVSVCEVEHHPYWNVTINSDDCIEATLGDKEILNKNRQGLPDFYRINGVIYVAYIKFIFNNKGFFSNKTYVYIMPNERSIDVNTYLDFKIAEILVKEKFGGVK